MIGTSARSDKTLRNECLMTELAEAAELRDSTSVWKIARRLAGTGLGSKRDVTSRHQAQHATTSTIARKRWVRHGGQAARNIGPVQARTSPMLWTLPVEMYKWLCDAGECSMNSAIVSLLSAQMFCSAKQLACVSCRLPQKVSSLLRRSS